MTDSPTTQYREAADSGVRKPAEPDADDERLPDEVRNEIEAKRSARLQFERNAELAARVRRRWVVGSVVTITLFLGLFLDYSFGSRLALCLSAGVSSLAVLRFELDRIRSTLLFGAQGVVMTAILGIPQVASGFDMGKLAFFFSFWIFQLALGAFLGMAQEGCFD